MRYGFTRLSMVIGDEVVGILHRVPANVTGDGLKSIRELVHFKNQDPLRGKGYHTPLEKIQLGEAEDIFLKPQQKNFETVPVNGEIVYLRENSNISTGGDSIDFTDDILQSLGMVKESGRIKCGLLSWEVLRKAIVRVSE